VYAIIRTALQHTEKNMRIVLINFGYVSCNVHDIKLYLKHLRRKLLEAILCQLNILLPRIVHLKASQL